MNESRIRLDLKPGGRAFITKSAIVAAVKILEQDKMVSFTTSQEVANWVVSHLVATHCNSDSGEKVQVSLKWAVDPVMSMYQTPTNKSQFCIVLSGTTIIIAESKRFEGMSISDALPMLLAHIIKKSPCVKVKDKNIDDFV